MYLQLAESGNRATRSVSAYRPSDNDNPYIFVPNETGGGTFVREDYFDDLTDFEWRSLVAQLAPYQPEVEQGMSESSFMGDRASRRKKRLEREAKKEIKTQQKQQKRDLKNKMKEARIKAKGEGRGANILGSVMDTIGGIFGGGGQPPEAGTENTPGGNPPEDTDKPQWQTTALYIAGGALLVGGIYYFATKK